MSAYALLQRQRQAAAFLSKSSLHVLSQRLMAQLQGNPCDQTHETSSLFDTLAHSLFLEISPSLGFQDSMFLLCVWLQLRLLCGPLFQEHSLKFPRVLCQACPVSNCKFSLDDRSKGLWEVNIQSTFTPRPDSRRLCDLRNYPSCASLFQRVKPQGSVG